MEGKSGGGTSRSEREQEGVGMWDVRRKDSGVVMYLLLIFLSIIICFFLQTIQFFSKCWGYWDCIFMNLRNKYKFLGNILSVGNFEIRPPVFKVSGNLLGSDFNSAP